MNEGDSEMRVVAEALSLSVVVPTRGRPHHIVACVQSILANEEVSELLVVDQSDDHSTEEKLVAAIVDPRFVYVRTDTRGVTNGRNVGIEHSKGAVICCVDDDCRAQPEWAARLLAILQADPDVAVVCGEVVIPQDLQSQGFAATFYASERVWHVEGGGAKGLRGVLVRMPDGGYGPGLENWGITANMAIRRSTHDRVGLFDTFLGAGGPLKSGGEPDFLFRVLRAGMKVVNAQEVEIEHLGVRKPVPDWAQLSRRYAYGIGAAYMKHIRCGDLAALRFWARHAWSPFRLMVRGMVRRRRPNFALWLVSFLRGSIGSLAYRVDHTTVMYTGRRW